jgi:rare lipoprotein A
MELSPYFLPRASVGGAFALLLTVIFSSGGCVPIRQFVDSGSAGYARQGLKSSPASGSDAWKNEMEGVASWYGEDFNGRLTASGEVYDMYAYTAAHKTLPLGTVVKVTNLDNGQTTQVRINDRGPFVKDRIIDLSRTAGRDIGMRGVGTANVKLEVVRWP